MTTQHLSPYEAAARTILEAEGCGYARVEAALEEVRRRYVHGETKEAFLARVREALRARYARGPVVERSGVGS